MSITSNWPLPLTSERYLVPKSFVSELSKNKVTKDLVPLAFGYYENAQGHTTHRVNHENQLMIFCVDGKGSLQVNQNNYDVQPGDVIFLPSGLEHKYQADKKTPWSIYWCHVEGEVFSDFMDIIGVSKDNCLINIRDLNPLISEFKQLLQTAKFGYQLNRFFLASSILNKILGLIALDKTVTFTPQNKELSKNAIDDYFTDNIERSLNLDQMSKQFGLSKFYFAKKFQQLVGTSPLKYFMHLKIQNACLLLDTTNNPIKTISKSVGYEDPYYFSRLFKQTLGISPSQYRQSRNNH